MFYYCIPDDRFHHLRQLTGLWLVYSSQANFCCPSWISVWHWLFFNPVGHNLPQANNWTVWLLDELFHQQFLSITSVIDWLGFNGTFSTVSLYSAFNNLGDISSTPGDLSAWSPCNFFLTSWAVISMLTNFPSDCPLKNYSAEAILHVSLAVKTDENCLLNTSSISLESVTSLPLSSNTSQL